MCIRDRGKQVLYLVPEQFSFEGEAQLHALLTGEESLQVEVLSFTRLCNRIFRSLGGLAGRYVDDTARCILMSVAVSEAQDQLEYYARQTKNTSFCLLYTSGAQGPLGVHGGRQTRRPL